MAKKKLQAQQQLADKWAALWEVTHPYKAKQQHQNVLVTFQVLLFSKLVLHKTFNAIIDLHQ